MRQCVILIVFGFHTETSRTNFSDVKNVTDESENSLKK